MVDSLREIEVAYSLLKSEGDSEKGSSVIDKHFEKLKTKVEVVDKKSDEFKTLQKYVTNTHASTHSHYKLVVEEVSIKLNVCSLDFVQRQTTSIPSNKQVTV